MQKSRGEIKLNKTTEVKIIVEGGIIKNIMDVLNLGFCRYYGKK